MHTFVGCGEGPEDRWSRALKLVASDDQTDLEEALDAFSFGDDFGDDDTDGREDGKKNGLSEGDARGGRGGGGSSGVAQKPQTSEQMKRELGEALQLWLDALDGEIESEEAIRHSHELFAGRELSADAWKRLDSISDHLAALARPLRRRGPWGSLKAIAAPLLNGLNGLRAGGRHRDAAPCISPRFALDALRTELSRLSREGEALIDEAEPLDARQVSLVHALAAPLEPCGALSRIGVLPLAVLGLMLAQRLGLEATIADSDGVGLLLRIECDASEDSADAAAAAHRAAAHRGVHGRDDAPHGGGGGRGGGGIADALPISGVPFAGAASGAAAADAALWAGLKLPKLPAEDAPVSGSGHDRHERSSDALNENGLAAGGRSPGGRSPSRSPSSEGATLEGASSEGARSEGAPLYLGLEKGSLGNLYEERELLDLGTPASALILNERVSLKHAHEFTSEVCLPKLLGELTQTWSKHYEANGKQPPAAFWSVQGMLLQRLDEQQVNMTAWGGEGEGGGKPVDKLPEVPPRNVVRADFEFPAAPGGYSKIEDVGFGSLFGL